MPRLAALFLSLGLLGAGPVFSQKPGPGKLEALWEQERLDPDTAFDRNELLPLGMIAFIQKRDLRYWNGRWLEGESSGRIVSHRRMKELYERFLQELQRPDLTITTPLGEIRRNPDDKRPGLRIHGFQIGTEFDMEETSEQPYLSKGLERLLDWNVGLSMRPDSLGVGASYRHPGPIERFSISAKTFVDVPELVGVGEARDDLYQTFGRGPQLPKQGYSVSASAVLDPHWGVSASHTRQRVPEPGKERAHEGTSVGIGYSPLGKNPGKPWNYTLLASVRHQKNQHGSEDNLICREGFGYSCGIAFQHALDHIPLPYIKDTPILGENLSLDRFHSDLTLSDSQIGPMSVRAAAGISAYMSRHLRLSFEAGPTFLPETDNWTFGARVGQSIRF